LQTSSCANGRYSHAQTNTTRSKPFPSIQIFRTEPAFAASQLRLASQPPAEWSLISRIPKNLPAGLVAHVLEGKVLYSLEAPHSGEQLVAAGDNVVIESGVLHHVAFVEPGHFYVEFYRAADSSK
jgi:hypothetical protein